MLDPAHPKKRKKHVEGEGGKGARRLDRAGRRSGGGAWNPGGHKGKLHREIGVPEGEKIPAERLEEAAHSKNPEIRRDAIRAQTMKKWRRPTP